MSHVSRNRVGNITYEAVDANIKGGQLVVPSTTATVSGEQGVTPAGANAINCVGVAEKDAVTEANVASLTDTTGPAPSSNFVTDATVPTATVTVYNDCITWITYAAGTALAYGDGVKCAANGQGTKWVSGTDAPERKIGWCAQKGGIGTGGGAGKIRVLV